MNAPATTPPRVTTFHWTALALIILFAAGARIWRLGANEAHFDELWHLESSTGRGSAHLDLPSNRLFVAPDVTSLRDAPRLWSIWTHMDREAHPPLYEMLLRGWRSLFGESIVAGRALSAVLSVFCIPALFWVVNERHGSGAALMAATLMALSSAQVEQAQEVRSYPMATLAVLCAAGAMLRVARTNGSWRWAAALAVFSLLSLMVHYFTASVLAALAIYGLLRFRGPARRRAAGAMFFALLAFALVWSPQLLRQRQTMHSAASANAMGETETDHVAATARRLATLPVRMLFEPPARTRWLALGGIVMYVLPWLLARRDPGLMLFAMWLCTVACIAMALDLLQRTQHLELARHVILASPAVCALAATMLWSARHALALAFPAAIALACAAALPGSYRREQFRLDDLSRALSTVDKAAPVVFSASPDQRWWAGVLYLGCSHYSGTFPRPAACITTQPDRELNDELRHWPEFMLVAANSSPPPEQLFPDALATFVGGDPYLGSLYRVRWRD